MKFDYNIEIENILNNIYEYKICEIIYKNKSSYKYSTNILDYKDFIINTKVYLGSDMHDFIINSIPKDKDGYYFRCGIANSHNYSFPRLYDYLGNPLKDSSYKSFAYQLWESHMNDFLIEDIEDKFTQDDFYIFVEKNLESIKDKIQFYFNKFNIENQIVIKFNNKNELLPTIKSMLLNNELNLSFAQSLIDLDALRDEMTKLSATFHMYNEFDKLEDNIEYCIENFCKYSSDELFTHLIEEKGFKFDKNIGLIKS